MPFTLINPVILGKFDINYKSNSPIEAAKTYWNNLSKKITNNVPQTFFTMQDDGGKLYHFKVSENKPNSRVVDFKIEPIDLKLSANASSALVDKFNEVVAQKGGRRHRYDTDDDSSSSDSSVDEIISKFNRHNYSRYNQPIFYYHYIPSVYYDKDDTVFIPTFIYPISPFIEIGFSTAFWA